MDNGRRKSNGQAEQKQQFGNGRPMGKTAYTRRVKDVLGSQKAQTVAKNFAKRFRTACKEVVSRRGAADDD